MAHRTPSQPLSQLLTQRPLQAVPTGVHSLDLSLHGGLVPGQLYEISGLNNTGKPTLAAQLCLNALKQNKRVLWVTMMQGLPLNTLLRLDPLVDLQAPHSRITHHRITNIAALFMLFMQLPTEYGLVIIDDFALAVNRSIGELEDVIEKPKVSSETRRTRTILECMKCINFYCGKSKAPCVFFNPVDTISMSFVEVESATVPLSSTPSMSSSQSFNNYNNRPKPKRINQQILVSALGDNSKWNSMFRARILLYKDWSQGNMSTATFANIKHSPAMRRILQAKGIQQRAVHFHVTKEGLKDAAEPEDGRDADRSRHEFTLDEKDLESDYDDNDENVQHTRERTQEHEETTTVSEKEVILPSSPCRDIQNARELLSSQMEELEKSGKSHLDITEEDLLSDVEEPDTNSTSTSPEATKTTEVSDTTELPLIEEKEVEEPQVGVEVDPLSNVLEELDKTDASVAERTATVTTEVDTEDEENGEENNNHELHDDDDGEEPTDDEGDRNMTAHEAHGENTTEELRIASMMSDRSFEVQEIEDELEELYPTQPEAISIVRLSQLHTRAESLIKRSKTSPETHSKRLKIVGEESQELDETIPATFPFF